ncbi:winged helix-turn-helix transcriptional regulator [Paenibacillus hodogayensis]|uniref:Winged helix-turn-helix transcriptional regulator n=1 Tax=Paenibacillus hodogayensis TaxID=279208 RepID=A0ABV5VVE8_9BACL
MEHNPESCMLDKTLNVIVGKWKLAILHLLFQGTKRFSELQHGIPDITKKVLTAHLRELEEDDIIKRIVYAEVPPRVEYSLTEYGYSLQPTLQSLQEWGSNHAEHMRSKRERQSSTKFPDDQPAVSVE